MSHGPQRGVSCREVPTKDNPIMQPVGLALPELYHLRAQDIATPTRRSRGLLSHPHPSPQALWHQMNVPGRSRSIIPQTGVLMSTSGGQARITHQYLGLGTSCSRYSCSSSSFFFLKYCSGEEYGGRARLSDDSFKDLLILCFGPGAGYTQMS